MEASGAEEGQGTWHKMLGREGPGHTGSYEPQEGVGTLFQKIPSVKTQEYHGLTYVFKILLGLLS